MPAEGDVPIIFTLTSPAIVTEEVTVQQTKMEYLPPKQTLCVSCLNL